MKRITSLFLTGLVSACSSDAAPSYKLTEAWATEPVLEVPECAHFNPADKLLYVSNVSGKPAEKNNKGFISTVDLTGKVVELKWATGLNAPKGMAIHGNSLYVSDIDTLVQIDLKTGRIQKRYPAEGAVFLNDVAADADGTIYAGDSSGENSRLYRLHQGKLESWLAAPDIERPNGLLMQGDRLLAGHGGDGTLYSIDLKTKKVTAIAKTDSGIDGLKPDGKGNYFTSNWKSRTALITAEGKTIVLMDTAASKMNAADFEYLPDEELLIVPTFFDNRLVAYHVEDTISVFTVEAMIGSQAPDVNALDQDGKAWSLQDHLGGRHMVIYFYPAAMTGGCTKQACSYRDLINTTKDRTFEIIGISGDTPANLNYFQQAEGLNFTLLSDPNGDIAKAYGVPVKTGEKTITRTVDGKEVELNRSATTARWTFIIDPTGKIVYRDDKVKAAQDPDNVMLFLKAAEK